MPSSEVGVGRVRARVLRVEHPAAVHPTLPHRVRRILQVRILLNMTNMNKLLPNEMCRLDVDTL